MNWEAVIGQNKIKQTLLESIDNNRVSHAQLFLGENGYGTLALALAYAQEILKRENEKAATKVEHLNHLDVHFSFPVFRDDKGKSVSSFFFDTWREMMLKNPYSEHHDWVNQLNAENKQLYISVDEILDKSEKFSLKSFEGGTKILIIWNADKMREDAANKFLKFLEEPPEKTIIILTANSSEVMLQTILSRCQIIQVPRIEEQDLEESIRLLTSDEDKIKEVLHQAQGNYNTALKLITAENSDEEYENYFIQWVRLAFQAKKNPKVLKDLIIWAKNISEWNREKQKNFLEYCAEMFRLAMLQNYGVQNLVYKRLMKNNFNWEAFSNFIHGANIEDILSEISDADYHLSRNANAKILWTDMGIKLTRYIHKSSS
ncbi:DNA polymerase III subunit delta' [Riemerella anatipestifer]|uniref:DNA polymerase III subunit n=1 Tax=Riemerella anatipestifer TaxID=34085 RepID=UPI000D68E689|nr:DNA polymerase III subunit delta' [Riemerella anatipestifer]MEE3724806.1 DNA polymerase III subunit delta' [Riemerella anatipestifer]MRM94069.1 DNA polymerase III subunit delta' [Riemerella anatipestifer]